LRFLDVSRLDTQADQPEDDGRHGPYEKKERQGVGDPIARRRFDFRHLPDGAHLRRSGVEEFSADGWADQQGPADGGARSARSPQQWHEYGADQHGRARLAYDGDVHERTDEHRAWNQQRPHPLDRPHEQMDQVLIAASLPQYIDEAERAADG